MIRIDTTLSRDSRTLLYDINNICEIYYVWVEDKMDMLLMIENLSGVGGYLALFMSVFICTATVFFVMPDTVIIFTAGHVGDPLLVGLVAGIASTIGELTTYFIGKGGEYVMKKHSKEGERYDHAQKLLLKHGFWAIPIFSLTPLPMDVIGLAAGVVRYDLKKFLLGVLIGKVPRCLILSYSGYLGLQVVISSFGF